MPHSRVCNGLSSSLLTQIVSCLWWTAQSQRHWKNTGWWWQKTGTQPYKTKQNSQKVRKVPRSTLASSDISIPSSQCFFVSVHSTEIFNCATVDLCCKTRFIPLSSLSHLLCTYVWAQQNCSPFRTSSNTMLQCIEGCEPYPPLWPKWIPRPSPSLKPFCYR